MRKAISGRKIVTTIGTAERLVSYPCHVRRVDVFAFDANTSRVHIGDANVQAPVGQEAGWPLTAKEGWTMEDCDLSQIWLDARVAGEGVSWGAVIDGEE